MSSKKASRFHLTEFLQLNNKHVARASLPSGIQLEDTELQPHTLDTFVEDYQPHPQSLLCYKLFEKKTFWSEAVEWGKTHKDIALEQYKEQQNAAGHNGLFYTKSGFVISEEYPFLGASPDAVVYDSSCTESFGLAEIKCAFFNRNVSPSEACSSSGFCSTLETTSDGESCIKLRKDHMYFLQVQGQMAITKRPWYNFVIYTEKGLSIERIDFDSTFWEKELLPKLIDFYDNCLAPEILSPVHVLGLPVGDLRKM